MGLDLYKWDLCLYKRSPENFLDIFLLYKGQIQ